MSRKAKIEARIASGYVEVKSKFDAEFRRFAIRINPHRLPLFEEFSETVRLVHGLRNLPFTVTYTDPEGDLLPINNDDNFKKALSTARPLLRLVIQRKGQNEFEINGYGTVQRKRNVISKLIPGDSKPRPHIPIGLPEDFRQVSAIIDVDILPETQRRVKLMRNGSDKPLGFYIRDGQSVRVMPHGLEKVPGIYISRLVQGGLAESTGLLAVNDEVLEVNGIEVVGKTLDQVTDMMVANSARLIITIKPVNQHGGAQSFEVVGVSDVDEGSPNLRVPLTADVAELTRDEDEDEIEEFVVPENEDFHSAKDEDVRDEESKDEDVKDEDSKDEDVKDEDSSKDEDSRSEEQGPAADLSSLSESTPIQLL